MKKTPGERWHELCRALVAMEAADAAYMADFGDDTALDEFGCAADRALAAFRALRDETSVFDEVVTLIAATYGEAEGMKLSVKRTRFGWAVFEDGARVSAEYALRERAEARMDRLAAARRPARRDRPCLRCRSEFSSEGAHNRLCPRCRAHAGGFDPMMMP